MTVPDDNGSSHAGDSTLNFETKTLAAGMLFKRMRGRYVTPVHIMSTGAAPLAIGKYSVKPLNMIAVFFLPRPEGSQITDIPLNSCVFQYKLNRIDGLVYDADGNWHRESVTDGDADGKTDPQDWTRDTNNEVI